MPRRLVRRIIPIKTATSIDTTDVVNGVIEPIWDDPAFDAGFWDIQVDAILSGHDATVFRDVLEARQSV